MMNGECETFLNREAFMEILGFLKTKEKLGSLYKKLNSYKVIILLGLKK